MNIATARTSEVVVTLAPLKRFDAVYVDIYIYDGCIFKEIGK
jgi:hypothetical protein